MFALRLARLEVLLGRLDRPGGMYPPLALASADVSPDERAAMDARMQRSELAAVWRVWSDATRTAADRANAIAELDPTFAHVHLLLADLFLRDDDAYAEPFPQLRATISALRPALGHGYARLLETLQHDYDRDGDPYLSRRGFAHSANETMPLLGVQQLGDTPDRLCFTRGRMAWGGPPSIDTHPELRAEIVEGRLVHSPGGASAQLSLEELASLECPELLTSLRVWSRGGAPSSSPLARATSLRDLTLSVPELRDESDSPRIASLPLESLAIELFATTSPTLPSWIAALPSLRSLRLSCTDRGVDRAAVEVPAAVASLDRLEKLALSGVGRLPHELGRLAGLRELEIRGWKLEGLPRSIGELSRLERLSVDPVASLPEPPEGFERLRALRELRLGHLDTAALPRVLLGMTWLERVTLVAARRWPEAQEAELRAALPHAYISIGFTGNAR
ncbi:MAG: hypothetical protein K1X94_23910 [Sandaracinaceae bacterium]|nr:hypothetical protein [Sandaracinaceae bacterium]